MWLRKTRWALGIALALQSVPHTLNAEAGPEPAQDAHVKFISINAASGLGLDRTISVRPGDVIAISADLVTTAAPCEQAEGCALNRDVEEFIWYSNQNENDMCDPANDDNEGGCLAHSHFEANDYGVNFYVSQNAPREIAISVRHRNLDGWAQLVLVNAAADEGVTLPAAPVASPEEIPLTQAFTDEAALNGNGRWVYISNERYWVPYSYQDDWAPYQNGYWSTTDSSYTWISYDPWGWFTDHYGTWRHHRVYGWIWRGFEKRVYHPAPVTWFHADNVIGWYPYHAGNRTAYRHGYEHGFDDGFHAGLNAGSLYQNVGTHFPGFTVVQQNQFTSVNIYSVRAGRDLAFGHFRGAFQARTFGHYPGAGTFAASRPWLETRIGATIPRAEVRVRNYTNFQLSAPVGIRAVPQSYLDVAKTRSFTRRIPLGSVVRPQAPGVGVTAGVQITPPMQKNRGIATPPQFMQAGQLRPIAPRTQRPAQVNPANPLVRPSFVPAVVQTPRPFRPGVAPVSPRPTPPAVSPRPRPQPPVGQPPVVRPQPPVGQPPVVRPQPPVQRPQPPVAQPPVVRPQPPVQRPQPPVAQPPVVRPQPPVQRPQPPVAQPPVVRPQPPVQRPQPPVAQPPVVRPQPPVQRPQPPVAQPPVVRPQPPVQRPQPPVAQPPVVRPQPPVQRPQPPVARPQPPVQRPQPPVAQPPRPQPAPARPQPAPNRPGPGKKGVASLIDSDDFDGDDDVLVQGGVSNYGEFEGLDSFGNVIDISDERVSF